MQLIHKDKDIQNMTFKNINEVGQLDAYTFLVAFFDMYSDTNDVRELSPLYDKYEEKTEVWPFALSYTDLKIILNILNTPKP